MLENKKYRFKVDNDEITFESVAYSKAGRGFVAYYGSQPIYDDEYDEHEWEVKLSFNNDIADYICTDYNYTNYLEENYPELYNTLFDEEGEWRDNTTEQEKHDVLVNLFEHDSNFENWIENIAQDAYDEYVKEAERDYYYSLM